MSYPLDVLIVGAGPIGLTLACHLRRLGLTVRLIEKRTGPSVHSKAIGLQYRVSEVLARLGVVERFVAQGGSPTTVNIYAGDERLVQLRFAAPRGISGRESFCPRAILIPQSQTEGILIDYYRELGGAVEWQTELESYSQSADRVLAQIRGADGVETIEAEWLVSCEGAQSVVRKQANISFRGKSYPLAFFMADVRMEGSLAHTENHVWLHADGSLAALPLPLPNTWRLFVEISSQAGRMEEAITVDEIHRFIELRAPRMGLRIVGKPLWLSDFRINCRMVDRMHDGRVFLAGDAAHIHSPTGGQGITTGMQDAANLAWKLARVVQGAPTALLDTYDEERIPHAEEVLRETDRTTTILFAPNRLLRLLRDVIVLPVLRNPWFQRRMFGKFSQLHVHYRKSSLSQEHRGSGWWRRRRVIRAGGGAPDVAFTDTRTGAPTTLFELMAPLRPVVLFNGVADSRQCCACLRQVSVDAYAVTAKAAPAGERSLPELFDRTGDFADLYGFQSDFLCLIRPDGHVGLVQFPPNPERLQSYLALMCERTELQRAFASTDWGFSGG